MKDVNFNPKIAILEETKFSAGKTSYRGFVSIDQEMERDIALTFFNFSKSSICSQKGFLFDKNKS